MYKINIQHNICMYIRTYVSKLSEVLYVRIQVFLSAITNVHVCICMYVLTSGSFLSCPSDCERSRTVPFTAGCTLLSLGAATLGWLSLSFLSCETLSSSTPVCGCGGVVGLSLAFSGGGDTSPLDWYPEDFEFEEEFLTSVSGSEGVLTSVSGSEGVLTGVSGSEGVLTGVSGLEDGLTPVAGFEGSGCKRWSSTEISTDTLSFG